MHGYGTYVFKTGETYQGDLKNGFKEGHGVCIYNDGREFEGSWSLNFKTGLGKVKFPNGVVFIGLFKANSLETEGVFIGKTLANDKSSSSLTDKVDIVW